MNQTNNQTKPSHSLHTHPILEQIKAQANHPSVAAKLVFQDSDVDLSTLLKQVDSVAWQLLEEGVETGQTVGLGMQRSVDLWVAMLAVWRAGATFVPLDIEYPVHRLQQIMADCQPQLVLVDEGNPQAALWQGTPTLAVSGAEAARACAGMISELHETPIEPSSIAYTIFTSGSTGRPKGVRISWAALDNFLNAMQGRLQFQSSDVWLAITALSFDIAILELLLPVMHGGTLVLANPHDSGDGHQLQQLLQDHHVTFMQATPVTWQLLLGAGWTGAPELTAISGGENLPRSLANQLMSRTGCLFNAYGPTEATIWALVEAVSPGDGEVPIGVPLDGYHAHVLDTELKATSGVGELYLGGISLATDYINQPAETAKQFIQHPQWGRLYATGDMVKTQADGKLVFVGREDQQVKVRGHRIELSEIENQLQNIDGIEQALVVIQADESQHHKLLAYVIFAPGQSLTTEAMRQTLKQYLPNHMMPNHFMPLSTFPLTPNKKIDRRQLPLPEFQQDAAAAQLTDPLEVYLQSVWEDVLGIQHIAAGQDFFDLGGDSILAARITNRVQDWLGELLWPVILFDAPTIAQLAQYLRENYPNAVAQKTDDTAAGHGQEVSQERVVDEALIDTFNQLNPAMIRSVSSATKNPQAIFLLCPPRSGSTLLRVMLAGSERIFAPPEIELLTFNTLRERSATFSGRESYRQEGLTRAVMEIKGCDVDQANQLLGELEQQDFTVQQMYGQLQAWLGDRLLLDKTPANCLDLVALQRIEEEFDNPLYIHLTRHPLGMIRSFLEARLAAVFFRRADHPFAPRELAELIWYTCNHNIQTLLLGVPANRQFRIGFEQLVAAPETHARRLAEFLGVPFQAEMVAPHRNKEKKMTDGLHQESKMMGDPKFHQHKSIDATVADRWKHETPSTDLGALTDALAVELGYPSTRPEEEEREDFIL